MTAAEIKNLVEFGEYEYIGIRVEDGVEYQIGEMANVSRVWVDNEVTDETLDGTSCIGFRANATEEEIEEALEAADIYYGDQVYLIAGNEMTFGEDDGEYIIKDAIVIARI